MPERSDVSAESNTNTDPACEGCLFNGSREGQSEEGCTLIKAMLPERPSQVHEATISILSRVGRGASTVNDVVHDQTPSEKPTMQRDNIRTALRQLQAHSFLGAALRVDNAGKRSQTFEVSTDTLRGICRAVRAGEVAPADLALRAERKKPQPRAKAPSVNEEALVEAGLKLTLVARSWVLEGTVDFQSDELEKITRICPPLQIVAALRHGLMLAIEDARYLQDPSASNRLAIISNLCIDEKGADPIAGLRRLFSQRSVQGQVSSKDQENEGEGAGASMDWQAHGNCLGVDPDLFFPARGASTREAKEVCRGCAVREDCLEYALENGEKFGIWGGMSERERRRLRRQRVIDRRAVEEAQS